RCRSQDRKPVQGEHARDEPSPTGGGPRALDALRSRGVDVRFAGLEHRRWRRGRPASAGEAAGSGGQPRGRGAPRRRGSGSAQPSRPLRLSEPHDWSGRRPCEPGCWTVAPTERVWILDTSALVEAKSALSVADQWQTFKLLEDMVRV